MKRCADDLKNPWTSPKADECEGSSPRLRKADYDAAKSGIATFIYMSGRFARNRLKISVRNQFYFPAGKSLFRRCRSQRGQFNLPRMSKPRSRRLKVRVRISGMAHQFPRTFR